MANQTLFFNIVPFDFPTGKQTFYFSLSEIGKCTRIHHTLFPNNIENIFHGIVSDGTEYIYTSFDYAKEGFVPLAIDFKTENQDFLRRFYNRQINYYFRKELKQLVRTGFIGQNQVWVPAKKLSNDQFKVFHKFSLKLQFCNVSKHPELVLSYDGKSKQLRTNLATLVKQVSPSCFNWVIKDNVLYRYDELVTHENPDYSNAFPVLNFNLSKAMGIDPDSLQKGNRYKTYKEVIDTFYDFFLNKPAFRKLIPLHEDGFLKVDDSTISYVTDASNDLAFENKAKGRTPKRDFLYKKPFLRCQHKNVHLFFIYHKDDQVTKDKLQGYLENGLGHYRGLTNYAGILFHVEEAMTVCFENRSNPLAEIDAFFSNKSFNDTSIKYLAIYLTPFTKEETRKQEVRVYVRVKELLLKRNIACQFVEPETVEAPRDAFKWSLTNMSVAILAKLGGIPWRLNRVPNDELIVGIGAFYSVTRKTRYVGSAFCFNNEGEFKGFECFGSADTISLAGSVREAVDKFLKANKKATRLIIHFYKLISKKELKPILDTLYNKLDLQIPVIVVTINKTASKELLAFDMSSEGLMPYSGTYIKVGEREYLLFNNTRYDEISKPTPKEHHFPVKIKLTSTQLELLEEKELIDLLIDQVYQFSRMYWKSVSQQNLPVTLAYPEMVAEMFPYFKYDKLPEFGKENLWFL